MSAVRKPRVVGWEIVLLVAILADIVLNARLSPYFLQAYTIADVSAFVCEKTIVAFPLALLIIAGEIDISVGAIIALASVVMGLAAERGVGIPGIVALGIATGAFAGMINGILVTRLRVSSIVATIGTMSLFRGIAYAVLGDRAIKDYPADFDYFGQAFIVGPISFELVLTVVVGIVCAIVLHKTAIGRRVYATGANDVAARWSGVKVKAIRFWLFVAVGAAAGAAAVLLTSRLGSTRPSIAQGWELDIISMVILGGITIAGGAGRIGGVALAAVLIGLVSFGLGLLNVPGVVVSMITGTMLIVVVALPLLLARLRRPTR
jgi:rhamnose transport system permease protein